MSKSFLYGRGAFSVARVCEDTDDASLLIAR